MPGLKYNLSEKAFGAGVALAVLTFFCAPAYAQYGNDMSRLMSRLNQIENQIQTLSRTVYRGEMPQESAQNRSAPAQADNPSALANIEIRLGDFESRIRTIQGALERQQHETAQIKTRLERALSDMEMRLNRLEQNAPVSAAPRPLAPPPSIHDLSAQEETYTPGAPAGTQPVHEPQTLGAISSSAQSPDALYDRAFSNIRNTRYGDAEAGFKQLLDQYPTHHLVPNAYYWLGETYYVRGDYTAAARTFAQGYQTHPGSAKAADSLLKLGLSLSNLGKKEDACLSFQQLEKEFADDTNDPILRRAQQEKRSLGCD